MCKKKTNKAKRINANKKIHNDEIREIIRHTDNLKFRGKVEEIKEELDIS